MELVGNVAPPADLLHRRVDHGERPVARLGGHIAHIDLERSRVGDGVHRTWQDHEAARCGHGVGAAARKGGPLHGERHLGARQQRVASPQH